MRRPIVRADGPHYRSYLLILLAVILALNGLDGTALGLVLPSVKISLHLTDEELGVLTGIAFSLFYSTVGIPIGRWADRGNRVTIIALATALWGVMVMVLGATRSFGELLMARVGVAVGEAGCVPAAYSLIADYFPREERPGAVAKYMLGGCASVIIGYLSAGWLSHLYGWRIMFICIGAPSAVVAPVAWWTLYEPRLSGKGSTRGNLPSTDIPKTTQVIQVLWRTKTFRYVLAVMSLNALFGSGISVWQPSFFARSYGLRVEELGLYLAGIYGVGGIIGTYGGGYLASRYASGNERLQLRSFAFLNAGFGVVSALIYLSRSPCVSAGLLGLAVIGVGLESGPILATVQTVIPERMRAIAVSVMYLFANLLGAGVGPLVVGSLSDALHPYFGAESLRYALLAMCPGYLAAGWLLWQGSLTVTADVETVSNAGQSGRGSAAV